MTFTRSGKGESYALRDICRCTVCGMERYETMGMKMRITRDGHGLGVGLGDLRERHTVALGNANSHHDG